MIREVADKLRPIHHPVQCSHQLFQYPLTFTRTPAFQFRARIPSQKSARRFRVPIPTHHMKMLQFTPPKIPLR